MKEIYKSNKELNNKSIFRNKINSITIINNTNNNYKYIIKRDINTKKIKTKNKNIINNNMKKDDIIINNLTKKEIDIINIYKYFNFWRIKNIKKIILNKFHSIFLISKFILKRKYIPKIYFFSILKSYKQNIKLNLDILIL